MGDQRKMRKGRLFFQFLFSYLMVLLIPIIVGTVAYNEAVNIVEHDAREASQSTLEQCMVVLDRRFAEVEGIATQLSMNPKVLEFARELSPYVDGTVPYKINELQKEVAPLTFSNNFINMLCIYFQKSEVTISTTQSYINLAQFYDGLFIYGEMSSNEWRDRVLNGRYFRECFPVTSVYLGAVGDSRRLEAEPMLMYMQSFPPGTLDKGHIMAFIPKNKIGELLQDIRMDQGGWAYITDSQGRVLCTFSASGQTVNPSHIYLKEANGFVLQNIGSKKMIVTYKTSSYNGWRYVAVLPYHVVMERVQYIKQLVVVILGVSLLLGLLGAYFMAYHSCKPIRSIIDVVQEMLGGNETGDTKQNEYAYLRRSILHLVSNNKNMQENLEKQLPLLKATFIERLLSGYFASDKEIQWFLDQLTFDRFNGKIAVTISRIDHAIEIPGSHVLEMGAVKLILKDTFEKYLGMDVYYHDLDFDKRVIIFDIGQSNDGDEKNYVEEVLGHVCKNIYKTHNIAIYFTVGTLAEDYMGISRSFEEAREALDYKTLHKEKSILWYSEIPRDRESYFYPLNIEGRLVNYAKLGDWKEIDKILKRVYKENFIKRSLAPAMVTHLIFELRGTMIKVLDILAIEHEESIKGIEEKIRAFSDCGSIDKMFTFILKVYEEICSLAEEGRKNRSSDIIEDILVYIHSNYQDSQLSLVGLADRFGFASAYLSQLFKDSTGENFSVYLERIRIGKACELLLKGMAVNQVSEKVGYNSVYVFRKAFKRVRGAAPSQYKGGIGIQEM